MKIIHVYRGIPDTNHAAKLFSTFLAVDKGVPSEVLTIDGGHRVLADDGGAVDFLRK